MLVVLVSCGPQSVTYSTPLSVPPLPAQTSVTGYTPSSVSPIPAETPEVGQPIVPDACLAVRAYMSSSGCIQVVPAQPPADQLQVLDRVFDTGDSDFEFTMYGNSQATIVVDDIPYAQYWQLDDPSQYVLHPMVVGRYLFNNADRVGADNLVPSIISRIGTRLPNGGLAFYYPNRYPLNRMRGPDYMYSAISQSEILAGFMLMDQIEQSSESRERLDAVLEALFFGHSDGGVNLAGVAQLELPLFRSNPEVILNGWLHSLLHLNDYASVYGDAAVSAYVQGNLRFFADNAEVWYDEARSISRYSDTSPQRVILAPDSGVDGFEAQVVYVSTVPELSNYLVPLPVDLDDELGGFDDRIVGLNSESGLITASVNCSGLFRTFVIGNDGFDLRVKDGGYDPVRASSSGEGSWHSRAAIESDVPGMFAGELSLDGEELICGFPTNFAKANGKNFYHIQHVVALLYLAQYGEFEDDELKVELAQIAGKWYRNSEQFQYRSLEDFERPQTVLDAINRGKLVIQVSDAESLFSRSGIDIFEAHSP